MAAIQPCALLLLIGADWRLEAVSANADLLGKGSARSLVGKPIAHLLDDEALHTLRNRMALLRDDQATIQLYGFAWGGTDLRFDIHARRHGGHFVVEAETALEPRMPDSIGMARSLMDRVTAREVEAIATEGLTQLRALTGFDRTILCGRDGSLLGVSERKSLRAPPRELDQRCAGVGARLIEDRDAELVPILGNCSDNALTNCTFLSPTEAEREWLCEQGIASAMTLPLAIDGDLVGAVHAHHAKPRRCAAERRAVASLFAERLAARMARHGWTP